MIVCIFTHSKGKNFRLIVQFLVILHGILAGLLWLFNVVRTPESLQSSLVDTGLNFLLFYWNRELIQSANERLIKEFNVIAYNFQLDKLVKLYEINVDHCREEIHDSKILEAMTIAVDYALNQSNCVYSDERKREGKNMFDELLQRERLHNRFVIPRYSFTFSLRYF